MTSPHDFLMAFMKELVHVNNVDSRPQIVQQWTEKLEAREAELRRGFYERFEKEYANRQPDGTSRLMDGYALEAAQKAADIS